MTPVVSLKLRTADFETLAPSPLLFLSWRCRSRQTVRDACRMLWSSLRWQSPDHDPPTRRASNAATRRADDVLPWMAPAAFRAIDRRAVHLKGSPTKPALFPFLRDGGVRSDEQRFACTDSNPLVAASECAAHRCATSAVAAANGDPQRTKQLLEVTYQLLSKFDASAPPSDGPSYERAAY